MSTRFRRALTTVVSVLTSAVLAVSVTAPAGAGTGLSPASAAACAATWSPTTAYSGGKTASHHGRNWTARWWTQRETPGSTSVWVDAGRCTGGGDDFVVSRAEFDAIFPKRHPFYTYDGFVDALGAYPAFASTGTPETRTREAAAFLTHADFESVGLRYVKEINEANYWIKCDDEQPFGCPAGQTAYYGRGPIMFSWNFNYKAAGDALGIDLLNDPWLVEEDPSVAWQTALWYWNTQPGTASMTCHDAIVGEHGFAETIRSINGPLECEGGNPRQMNNRVRLFRHYVEIVGTTTGDHLTC